MDIERHLLALIAPARPGVEMGAGAVFEGVSVDAGLRFLFRVGGAPLLIEVSRIEDGRAWAARSLYFGFAYRAESFGVRVDSKVGGALCHALAAMARRNEEQVLSLLRDDAAKAVEQGELGARVREVRVGRALYRAMDRGRVFYSLSPYAGCLIGCRFCYAQERVADLRRFAGQAPPAWGSYVDVYANAPDRVAKELLELEENPIKFCPIVSDPYQRIEEKYRITRGCLEAISDAEKQGKKRFPVIILTRSAGILRDVELLAGLSNTFGGVSIPTVDDEARVHFEPRAASVEERFRVLGELRAAGISTFAVVQPIWPGSVDRLADALAASVSSVSLEVLRSVEGAEREFLDVRYAHVRDPAWQMERLLLLRELLEARGVRIWEGELPPELIE